MKLTDEISGMTPDRVDQTSDIVSAYVSNNHVAPADLPALIATVHSTLQNLAIGEGVVQAKEPEANKPTAAQIRKSVQPDGIVSFIDGRPYKTLKRHLTKHGLDPQTYRARYGLPSDYPMVAASYSETRSGLAKALGLGQQRSAAAQQEVAQPARKGRKKAA